MLGALAINTLGAVVLFLDERRIDREFWIALAVFSCIVWGTYTTGTYRGLFS